MSDSSCSEDDGKLLKLKKFHQEITECLERLHTNGMTGWGTDHSDDIEWAMKSTGLSLSQVRVMLGLLLFLVITCKIVVMFFFFFLSFLRWV